MSQKEDLLRVAPPKGTQHATNVGNGATTTATRNATDTLKALANGVVERNNHRNSAQTGMRNKRNKYTPENTTLLRSISMVPDGQADPLRWPRFVAMCEAQGVGADDVKAMFSELDIDDLCKHADDLMPELATTIVQAIKRAPTGENIQIDRISADRWQRFLDLCVTAGLNRRVVIAEFSQQDIRDLTIADHS